MRKCDPIKCLRCVLKGIQRQGHKRFIIVLPKALRRLLGIRRGLRAHLVVHARSRHN